MSMFEYLMVIVSIILGLGITQILRGFSKVARSHSRSAVVVLFGIYIFTFHIQVWWALWDLHAFDAWNLGYFIFLVSIPCLLFACAELLFPMATTAETDWKAHYDSVRVWFLGTLALLSSIAVLETWLFLDVPLTHAYRIIQVGLVALLIVGMFTKSHRMQLWLICSILIIFAGGQAVFRLLPGLA
jgi:hypothetical protein